MQTPAPTPIRQVKAVAAKLASPIMIVGLTLIPPVAVAAQAASPTMIPAHTQIPQAEAAAAAPA
jgi:hypothetical protein